MWLLVFGLALVGAFIVGAFVLMAIVGLAVITFLGFKLRGWWLRRRSRGGPPGSGPEGPAKGIRYIEAEYEVLDSEAAERWRREGRR
ncbi:MAG TPA: hypothetical protein VLI71_01710 [Gammaproteobacteria bacterium]|nr:hypothetical protein [Gammaproteobacteria bacterium]